MTESTIAKWLARHRHAAGDGEPAVSFYKLTDEKLVATLPEPIRNQLPKHRTDAKPVFLDRAEVCRRLFCWPPAERRESLHFTERQVPVLFLQ